MKRSNWKYYGVKLVYQATIHGDPIPERIDENYSDTHTFFEESILLVHAQSFDHAYTIAERKAREMELTYRNPYGQTVEKKLIEAVDCYWINEALTNGVEVYSCQTPCKKGITPDEYIMQKYQYSIECDDWNDAYTRNRRRLQTVLLNEDFSKWAKA